MEENNNNVVQGEASGAWGFLGFAVPLAGLIIYLSCKNNHPSLARKAGKGALINVIIVLILNAIYIFLMGVSLFD